MPGTWIVREDPTPGRGPRVAVKDLIDVAGVPTTAGSLAVARRAQPATGDAGCLAGLRAAAAAGRAVLAGKVGLHELAYGVTGINNAFGTPTNPLDPKLVPGGSSSGSAVAVATGEADIAYGSDTGGSIRIPAACCGVSGLKTTWGRIPVDGVRPLAPSFDTVGPMARDVAGLVAGMALLEPGFSATGDGVPAGVDGLRIGRVRPAADPLIDDAIDRALRRAGWEVTELPLDLEEPTADALTILDAEAWASQGTLLRDHEDEVGHGVAERLRAAASVTPQAVAAARSGAERWKRALGDAFARVDFLALPTLAGFPPPVEDPSTMARVRGGTAAVNLAGVPALALPVPSGGPLPASLQLVGPLRSEERLLAAGAHLEQAVAS